MPVSSLLPSSVPTALFVLGVGGSGKSTLSEAFVQKQLSQSGCWCIVDKDVVGSVFVSSFLECKGLDPEDRDSDAYMTLCRDLEYATCLRISAHQLNLGCNVILPGPWSRELSAGLLFSAESLGLPPCNLRHVYLHTSHDMLYQRIAERNSPRDTWKLSHWEEYLQRADRMAVLAQKKQIPVIQSATPLSQQIELLQQLLD